MSNTLAKSSALVSSQSNRFAVIVATANASSTPFDIGPMPSNCVMGPEPMTVQPEVAPVVGGYPAWVAGFQGAHAQLPVLVSSDVESTPYGWKTKLLWTIKNSYTGKVIIHASNLADQKPLWFQSDNTPATTALVIDASNRLGSTKDFTDYGSYIFIAHSGCYQLEAQWDGGYWRFEFAAGRDNG